MNIVSAYVLRVGAFLIMAMVLENALPETSIRRYIKFVVSLLFVIVLIGPVVSWLRNDISLDDLTLGLDEKTEQVEENYEAQARQMVLAGYGDALITENLPPGLRSEYQLMEIDVREDSIRVTVARKETEGYSGQRVIGSWRAEDFDFGEIGFSKEEEDNLKEGLADYWGISEERLEIKLR